MPGSYQNPWQDVLDAWPQRTIYEVSMAYDRMWHAGSFDYDELYKMLDKFTGRTKEQRSRLIDYAAYITR